MKKILSVFLVAVMLLGVLPVLPMAQRAEAVTGIEYEKKNPVICYFETSGSFDTNSQGEQYFRYDGFGFSTGDVLVVYYEGLAQPIRYTAIYNDQERRMEFIAEDGDIILSNEVHTESNQAEQPFTIGSDNYYYVCYKTFKAPVQVTVVDNPVKKVEYIPIKAIEIYENTDGQWETDNQGNEYFDYYNPSFEEGDILRITLNTGAIVDYTYGYNQADDEWFFYDGNGNALENNNELFTTKGHNGNWSLGDNNNLYIIYKDVYSEPVKVSIIENNVKAIRFTPAKSAVYVEGTNMNYDSWDDAYYYEEPWLETGDVLTVIDKNSNEKAYTFDDERRVFAASDGDEIESREVKCYSNQRDNPWTVGTNNAYSIEYRGQIATAYVTITENPVKAISFVPVKQAEYIEGTNMYYDSWDDAYYYDEPYFEVGDILKVTDKNNVTTSYVFGYDDEFGGVFKASNGKTISTSEIKFRSDQENNPWTVGLNDYTIEYSGKTCTAKVKITANPVDSIEYTPKTPAVLVEGQDMWYDEWDEKYYYSTPRMEEGDILTVHYNDGRGKVDYTLTYDPQTDTSSFISADGAVIETDWDTVHTYHNQNSKPWTLGSDNYYYVEYSGKSASIPVTIIENKVSAISFVPQKEITIFTTACKKFYDDNGNEHREYSVPEFEDGDKLIITDKEGISKEYVYSFDEADGEDYFVNGDEKIHRYELAIDSYLLGDDWEVGADNYFTIGYMGAETQVKVNLIDTDVKSIGFKKVSPVVLTENQGGSWRFNDRGIKFYYYEAMLGNVGDVLTVNYLNGTTLAYTVKFDVQNETAYLEAPNGERLTTDEVDVYEDQFETPWTPGGENVYYVTFHGITTTVPVTVNHDYAVSVIQPKANAVGYTLHTCKACSESYKTDFKAPTGKPATFKCSARTATAEKFVWSKTSGVSGYQIQLLNSAGKSAALASTTGTTYTFTKLASGHAYKARVRFFIKAADGKNYYGAWTTINSPTLPAGTSIKLTPARRAFIAQWKKGACTGYQLQYSTNVKFSGAKTVTIKNAKTLKYIQKNLAAKKTYFVRVRTYKTLAGKNYFSVWSAVKKVTTKVATASKTTNSKVVYITPTGKRYHYDSKCGNGKYIKSSLNEALKKGLTPCKKCVH